MVVEEVAEAVEAGEVGEDVTVGLRPHEAAGRNLLLRRHGLLPTGPPVPVNVQRIRRVVRGDPLRDARPQVQRPRNGRILEILYLLRSAVAIICFTSC